jgi:dihydrofolate synthase/folylpolyglutamate synthase
MSQVLLLSPQASLRGRGQSRIRPDLAALRKVLARLGDPQLSFPSLLIAGTNGKGSSAAMVAAILSAHGLRTGLYTSPHLVRVEERIRLDGEMIGAAELGRHLGRLDDYPELTYFETVTAAAWLAFAEHRVDIAVLEAGMGGRWDATRLAASALAGLTNVGSDHCRWLGQTPEERASDKGQALAAARLGIIGPGVAADLVPHLGAPAAVSARSLVEVHPVAEEPGRVQVSWPGFGGGLTVPLAGAYQVANLHLALALARGAVELGWLDRLQPAKVSQGLAGLRWPGRLSRLLIDGHEVLLDGAHNLESAQALARHLAGLPERYNLLFSCLDDKPVDEMAAALLPHVGEVVVCALDDERAMPLPRLVAAFPGAASAGSPVAGLARLRQPMLAAGSLRLVGALMAAAEGAEP